MRIFSAIQPSGELHIGNYLGALKNFVELQNKYECFFFIADYHSITENYNPKEKPNQIFNLALDFLAIGLNPKNCTIAIQSQIPEHTELAWIFNTIIPVSELERMTQFKDKASQQKKNVNMGLFDYPVLQAADILMYKTELVPIGQDQLQHIELTRKIARLFNNKFGKTFPEPQSLLTKTQRVASLTDPIKKMSKSLGSKSYIGINDSPELIKNKIKKAVSATNLEELFKIIKSYKIIDTGNLELKYKGLEYITSHKETHNALGVISLFNLLNIFGTIKHKKYFAERFKKKDVKFSELKEALSEDIANYFAPFRKKRKELEKNPDYVKSVLSEGVKKARLTAQKTMKEVKEKIGLI